MGPAVVWWSRHYDACLHTRSCDLYRQECDDLWYTHRSVSQRCNPDGVGVFLGWASKGQRPAGGGEQWVAAGMLQPRGHGDAPPLYVARGKPERNNPAGGAEGYEGTHTSTDTFMRWMCLFCLFKQVVVLSLLPYLVWIFWLFRLVKNKTAC